MILVCKGSPIGASDAILGSSAILGVSSSEWVCGMSLLVLGAGVDILVWIGEDGKPSYSRTSMAPAASKDHFAEFSASLEGQLGSAHSTSLLESAPKTVVLEEMAQRAAEVGAALATLLPQPCSVH